MGPAMNAWTVERVLLLGMLALTAYEPLMA